MLNDHLHGFGIRPRQCDGWAAFLSGRDAVNITVAPLEQGLWLPDPNLVIVTETQLYGERVRQERRFGVRHKEQMKSLRAEVDVLTLTATPIPRTLNLVMSGLRDLSIAPITAPTPIGSPHRPNP